MATPDTDLNEAALQQATFIEEQNPECSIIVLAWHLTTELLDSLASIAASQDAPPFEVVLVLNGALDGVRDAVRDNVSGATIVDLAYNAGFGGGCNAGAAEARGTHVVFLNDDTVVDALWLRRLRDSVGQPTESGRPVGAVVGVLLNVDGTVQEAGSRMLAGRGTVQLGAGRTVDEARAAGLLVRRAVDYGAGAALLVVGELFRRLGGFDPMYEPAYYEDVDLQFRIKSAGYEVIFEPTAIVTHIGGASTSSSSTAHLFREWAGAHASYAFQDRWAKVLEGAPAADAPLSALCPISPDELVPGTQAELPTAAQIAAGSAEIALAASARYADWLVERLARVVEHEQQLSVLYDEAERGRIEYAERITRESVSYGDEIAGLRAEVASSGQRAQAARDRLAELERRNIIGVVKWRAGLVVARRRRSKAARS